MLLFGTAVPYLPAVPDVVHSFLLLAQAAGHVAGTANNDGGGDWITQAVRNVLVGQAVTGTIALIGLFAIIRRFLSHEFPATMASINGRLDTLHEDFKGLETEFRRSLLEVERMKEKIENLTQRQNHLDDTMWRRRQAAQEREGG